MERPIKFRALKDDQSNCNWVYGCLVYDAAGIPRITEVDSSGKGLTFHTCIAGTEGQFTGMKDKDGVEVYDGDHDANFDVVMWCDNRNGWSLKVYDFPTKETIFCHCYNCEGNFEMDEIVDKLEIAGNIYEPTPNNPTHEPTNRIHRKRNDTNNHNHPQR